MGIIDNDYDNFVTLGSMLAYSVNRRVPTGAVSYKEQPDLRFRAAFMYGFYWSENAYVSRVELAAELNHLFPEFQETFEVINKHGVDSVVTNTILEEELNLILNFYSNPKFRQDYHYLTLLSAYYFVLYFQAQDDRSITCKQNLFNELNTLSSVDHISGVSNVIIPIILWFYDYKGYKEKVFKIWDKKEQEELYKQNQAVWQSQGKCRYCGGSFKGLFKKTCSSCQKVKDY